MIGLVSDFVLSLQVLSHTWQNNRASIFVFVDVAFLMQPINQQTCMKEGNPITMKDIAQALGVSVATVSRALQDSPRISEERRNIIKRYAREHHFNPNFMAGSLRKSRVQPLRIIGVIQPQFTHYYFSSILTGIEEEAALRGYRVIVAQSNEQYEQEVEICRSFADYNVCGVIVSQAKDTKDYSHFSQLQELGIPLVFYDRICTGLDVSRVVVDDYMGAFNAVNYLIATGCRRIAFFGSPMQMEISKNRYNGYKDAILKAGLKPNPEFVVECDHRARAEEITPELLSREVIPDGFFAVNDDTAIGILYSAKRMGYRVPQDISICGFTNGDRAIACDPMLTTVEQRGVKVGQEAADILINKVEGKMPWDKVEKRVVRTRLIVRGTTR